MLNPHVCTKACFDDNGKHVGYLRWDANRVEHYCTSCGSNDPKIGRQATDALVDERAAKHCAEGHMYDWVPAGTVSLLGGVNITVGWGSDCEYKICLGCGKRASGRSSWRYSGQ